MNPADRFACTNDGDKDEYFRLRWPWRDVQRSGSPRLLTPQQG